MMIMIPTFLPESTVEDFALKKLEPKTTGNNKKKKTKQRNVLKKKKKLKDSIQTV